LIWLLCLFSLPRVIAGWKRPPETEAYFTATPRDRWTYAIAYPLLAAILAVAGYCCGAMLVHTGAPRII